MAARLIHRNIFQTFMLRNINCSQLLRKASLTKNFNASALANNHGLDFHTSASREGVTPVKMPSLSPTMTEGTIVKWMKKEGDPVVAGDVLCEIQTDKAVVALEFDENGILAKVLMPEDSADVKVGTLIALMVDEGDDWKNVEIPKDLDQVPTPSAPSAAKSPSAPTPTSSNKSVSDHLVGPSVKNLLAQYGLDLSKVPRNGPHGALLKGDVLAYASQNSLKPVDQSAKVSAGPSKDMPKKTVTASQSPSPFIDIELTNMRRTIAKRLLQSKSSIAHSYSVVEVSVSNMTQLRKRMLSFDLKVSVNDFIVKAVSNALLKCPNVNVVWEGTELKRKGVVDVSVAVATNSGLITPIVTDVSERDVLSISSTVKVLAEKARDGKLQPQEFMGGTFTISNLGMFGVHHFSAIINPPQCAILAVGGSSLTLDENGKPKTTTCLTLSYDASAISEEDSSKFLATLKHEIESISEVSMGLFNLEGRSERILLSQ